MSSIVVVVVDPADDGARADVVLGRRAPGLSRRVARQRALAGALRIDGRRAPPSTKVRRGMRLELELSAGAAEPPPALTVLAVTERYVYVDKPPGVHTVRLRPDDPPTLGDAVVLAHPECGEASEEPNDAGAVHRLDRGTSGVVCYARTREAWRAARTALSAGRVDKLYLARVSAPLPDTVPLLSAGSVRRVRRAGPSLAGIVEGHTAPAGLCVDAPLSEASGAAGRRRVRLAPDGRDAMTEVWAVTSDAAPGPLVALSLLTGHRHQARVHVAALGCPIVGDPLYGAEDGQAPLLHAGAFDLGAAVDGEARVASVLPDRFRA